MNKFPNIFKKLDKDNSTKVIILEGSGNGFSAGHNLKEVKGLKKRSKVTNIFKFIQQSRQEASKIVWPNRRETITTTVMVFIMVAILATFFFITDSIISFLLRVILSLSF